MSRDYVLLAEQRAAEVDLKNRCARRRLNAARESACSEVSRG